MAIKGIWTASITPLSTDGAIDHEKLAHHCTWLLGECSGVVLFGSTGEAPSFSLAERQLALESLIDRGVDPRRLIVGTGCTSLPETVALTGHATDLGVAGTLVIPPFFFKGVDQQGVLRYYRDLIESFAAGLALYLYNFPKLSGVTLSPELVRTLLTDYPEAIQGIKDSTGDWNSTSAFLDISGLAVYPGTERLLAEAKAKGAPGIITATGNINAAGISAAWATDAGLTEMVRVRDLLEQAGTIVGAKAWLSHRHDDPTWRTVRSPFVGANDEAVASLMSRLTAQSPA